MRSFVWPRFLQKGNRGQKSGSSTYWVKYTPPCTERQSLNKECGWKGGDRGGKQKEKKREKMKEKS